MSNTPVYTPAYVQIVHKKNGSWYFLKPGRIVYTDEILDTDFFTKREKQYDLTKLKIAVKFHRITGGNPGFYLADMKHKKYFYCGKVFDDVRSKLLELGIGRIHPMGL